MARPVAGLGLEFMVERKWSIGLTTALMPADCLHLPFNRE